jgi:hypothetical protein
MHLQVVNRTILIEKYRLQGKELRRVKTRGVPEASTAGEVSRKEREHLVNYRDIPARQ